MVELWEWEIDTNKLNPILDPLTIITNIINKEVDELMLVVNTIIENNVIIKSSILNNIRIILFRHQHILIILEIIMIFIRLIFRIFYIQSRYFY